MTIFSIIAVIVLGLVTGTVINVLADVLPSMYDLNNPDRKIYPLRCGHCNSPMRIIDYLMISRCKQCARKQGYRKWAVVLIYPVLFVSFMIFANNRFEFWQLWLLFSYFGLVVIMDLEHHIILEVVSIAGVIITILLGWKHHGFMNTLWGGIAGFGIMLVLYYLGILFAKIVSKGREQPIEDSALGAGDIRLGGVIGLLLGWPGITLGLLFAILSGGFVSLFILLRSLVRRNYQSFMAIPYAPFLVFGALVLLFWPR